MGYTLNFCRRLAQLRPASRRPAAQSRPRLRFHSDRRGDRPHRRLRPDFRRAPGPGDQAAVYVTIIRNLPILVLVLFAFFALPQLGVRLGKIEGFVEVLSIYSGAYLAEVFRAGLLSIPKGLGEAGLAIGLTPMQIRVSISRR